MSDVNRDHSPPINESVALDLEDAKTMEETNTLALNRLNYLKGHNDSAIF
jgi:hypothetical protein